jgi:hypothetical protein
MHQNDYFIVLSSQTLLHVSAYQRHHPGVRMILTRYLHIGVPLALFHNSPLLPTAVSHNYMYPQRNNTDWS